MKRLFPGSWNRIVPAGAALAAAIALLAPCAAQATPFVVKLFQKGNNVVAKAGGSFNLTGLTLYTAIPIESDGWKLVPDVAEVDLGPTVRVDWYTGFTGPTSFGIGGEADAATGAGSVTGILGSAFGGVPAGLAVPVGYSSGTALSSSATWDNASATSLGVLPGIYKWTWGTGADQSFTLDAFRGVPEPAALGMLGFGLLLVGGFVKLRPRQPGSA